jgi:hypothetical protein
MEENPYESPQVEYGRQESVEITGEQLLGAMALAIGAAIGIMGLWVLLQWFIQTLMLER